MCVNMAIVCMVVGASTRTTYPLIAFDFIKRKVSLRVLGIRVRVRLIKKSKKYMVKCGGVRNQGPCCMALTVKHA